MLAIASGETLDLESPVEIVASSPDVREGKPVPTVLTMLVIEGAIPRLRTGVQPRPAVSVETAPKHVTLFPNLSKEIHLQPRSYLHKDMEARVSVAPAPGLTIDWTQRNVSIPARSFAALPITGQAVAAGVYPMQVTVYFEGQETPPERIALFGLPAGGVLADQDGRETRLGNEYTRLILHHRGGGIHIRSSQRDAHLSWYSEQVGPPFWPSELDDKEYEISLTKQHGYIAVAMAASLETYPGLTLRRLVS